MFDIIFQHYLLAFQIQNDSALNTASDKFWVEHVRKLEGSDLVTISQRVSDRSILRKLGFKLKIEQHEMDSVLHNNRDDIHEATYVVVNIWFANQQNTEQAFLDICDALDNISQRSIIRHITQPTS